MRKKLLACCVFVIVTAFVFVSCELIKDILGYVTVVADPSQGGQVKIGNDPWTGEASETYSEGSIIQMEANPSPGWLFVGWFLDTEPFDTMLSTSTSYNHLILSGTVGEKIIIGKFEIDRNMYTLNVNTAPSAGGNFYIPDLDNSPRDWYTGDFASGETIRIQAETAQGYTFNGFYTSGGTLLEPGTVYDVLMNEDKDIEVRFNDQ